MRSLIYFILILTSGTKGFAQSKILDVIKPGYVQAQYAGNIGLVSAGIGYNMFHDKLHVSIMDGFVPKSIAGNNINTVALKAAYDIYPFRLANDQKLVAYAGLATTFETSGNGFYTKLPERYSDGYYKNSAFHLTGFAGGKWQIPVGNRNGQRLELYAETGTIDAYVYYYLKNEALNFTDMFSAAFGASYHFGKK